VDGAYTVYRNFEIMNSSTDRANGRHAGVYLRGAQNVKIINLIIHDTGMGIYAEEGTSGCEIYGNIIYNGGWETSARSNGHGMYLKQNTSGQKFIRNNILFNSFGLSLHGYTDAGTGQLRNMTFERNVAFNSGTLSTFPSANVLIGGEEVADNITFRDNMTYFSPSVSSTNVRFGYLSTANGAMTLQRNYLVGGTPTFETGYWTTVSVSNDTLVGSNRVVNVREADLTGYSWSGNRYFRDTTATAWQYSGTNYTLGNWRTATGLGATDQGSGATPAATRITILPNAYEAGRATIVVYNWAADPSASVDLSSVLASGDQYEVRNVQTWFGSPVTSGTYSGAPVSISLAAVTPTPPIGGSPIAPMTTGPAFNVFVVRRVTP
jgi:parallel beta-helix repeat protein